ncbi:TetR/AcrR family transcriptional regulator [Tepidibacter thalassicus]|uniref:Transcriptional regulator, TetR family n=1 Tax=Tepidibacter thalassicus DSM 15285 TaxID=1123350 RepID=A0A1M5QVG0_9FIRM|nr:TetR/AcrR family transcriptional regulator [Tepidibacter thalassicus]SHH18144.1 transcriptional regulator, TetR family [Tepidibacter thalassicus DSM 15285]
MTAQKIKIVTLELLAQKGYEGTSLSEIAYKVGIKKPSIYGHFTSKEEIFFSVLNEEIIKFEAYINQILLNMKNKDIKSNLFEFLKEFIEYFYKNSVRIGFWSSIVFFPPFELREKIKIKLKNIDKLIYNSILEIICKEIKIEDISEEDLDNIIYSYICILKGSFAMLIYDKKFDIKHIEYIWETYLIGIENKLSSLVNYNF